MSAPVRVSHVDDLPPGKGRVVHLGACEVAVWNLEGRYYARVAHLAHVGGPLQPGHADPHCPGGGQPFDATVADSPARAQSGEPRYDVSVEDDYVVVYVEEELAD
jgi:nitrite reductase/ring-hydroxylating ferredoxin subunit